MNPNAASDLRVVLVTVDKPELADFMAQNLVEKKLAACVNVISNISSHYRWEGKLHKDQEHLLLIKTRAGLIFEIIQFIKEKHPAKVPEIISLPIMEGEKNYLQWIGANTLFAKSIDTAIPL